MKWEQLTSREFDDAIQRSGGLCVMPLGCLETHGEHLATGCDSVNVIHAVNQAAELEEVVVFPTGLWLGDMIGSHAMDAQDACVKHKRGNIALSPQLLLNILSELCEEIHRNGFRKILIVNGHGGNAAVLNYFLRAQNYEKRDYATMWTMFGQKYHDIDYVYEQVTTRPQDFPALTPEEMATLERLRETGYGGGHGDFREAVCCLAAGPEYVRPDKYDSLSGRSTRVASKYGKMGVTCGRAWAANFPNSYSGFPPFGATENLGKVYMQLAAEYLAGVFKMLKEDELCVALAQHKENEFLAENS